MNSYIIAVEPAISPTASNSQVPVSSLDTFLAILIPVAVAAGAYARQCFVTKTSAEEAESALIESLKEQVQVQQQEIYRLTNELRITRQTLENSGAFAPPVPRNIELKNE